jgi:AraC-like DNA-binding protein
LVSAICRTQNTRTIAKGLSHPCWVFDYSISACGLYRVGNRARAWRARPAHVGHLYAPHVHYAEDLRSAQPPIQDAWFLFQGGEIAGLERFVGPSQPLARFLDPGGLLQSLILEAADTGRREGQAGFWKAQACLCELLNRLLQSRPKPDEPGTFQLVSPDSTQADSAFVVSVRQRLHDRLAEPLTLADLAADLHMSVSTLCHRYQAETGLSPMAERLRRRLALAQSLLLKGRPLKIIAQDTGFCDPYHLSKAFKRLMGLSPRAFVRSLAGDKAGRFPSHPPSHALAKHKKEKDIT